MALSDTEKESLENYYHAKDLYDPSKEKDQEPSTFMPKPISGESCMCGGGHVPGMCGGGNVKGYADGGLAEDSGTADNPESAYITNDQQQAQAAGRLASQAYADPGNQAAFDAEAMPPAAPQSGNQIQKNDAIASPAYSGIDPAAERAALGASAPTQSSKLQPDQMQELIQALTQKQGLGQAAMSGIAGLADAIETGVARAGNPGFQKNITEQQQNQKNALIAALEAKYKGKQLGLDQLRVGQEGQRIGEEGRHNIEGEKETRLARQLTQQQQDLALRNAKIAQGMEQQKIDNEETKSNTELAQKGSGAINAIERKFGFGPPLPGGQSQGPVPIKSHADYMRLPAGTHYVDSKGKEGIKK